MQQYGKNRDLKILEGLEKFRYMNTNQIAELYFSTVKRQDFKIKKTCERMKKMFDRGYVQRFRFPSEPYIFTVHGNKYNRQIGHYLMIVDCWIVLRVECPSGGVLRYEVEVKDGDKDNNVQTDLVIEYINNFRGEKKIYWIEVENESNGDIVEKVKKYEGLVWEKKINSKVIGELVIVYKNKRTLNKLEGNIFDIRYRVIHISELKEKWEW